MCRARHCQELAELKGTQKNMANGFEKKHLRRIVGGMRGEAVYYLQDVGKAQREHVLFVSGPNNVTFSPEVVSVMDGLWE